MVQDFKSLHFNSDLFSLELTCFCRAKFILHADAVLELKSNVRNCRNEIFPAAEPWVKSYVARSCLHEVIYRKSKKHHPHPMVPECRSWNPSHFEFIA